MAHHGSFSSSLHSHGSHGSASPAASASSASASAAPMAMASFSVFQEGPGQPLVFSPPVGTPELLSMVDLFVSLDVPVSTKMEIVQRHFEAHVARTNERYKTYFVPAPGLAAAGAPTTASPSALTASPSPVFPNAFDAHFGHQSASLSGTSGYGSGGGSGSGSLYFDASPAPRPSPTDSDMTAASDTLFPLSTPMFPAAQYAPFHGEHPFDVNTLAGGGFFPTVGDPTLVAMAAPTPVSASSVWLTSGPHSIQRRQQQQQHRQHRHQDERHQRPSAQPLRRRLAGTASMQILTRTGEDVTHVSSRATRTHEERENTRLVRQRGACPDCRRKKTRCNPDHVGSTLEHGPSRGSPYTAAAQSGRAKEEAAAAKAEKSRKEKVEGKRVATTTTDPVFLPPQALAESSVLAGVEDGGGGGGGHTSLANPHTALDVEMFQDFFDWDQVSDQGRILTTEDLEVDIATTLAMAMPSTTMTAPSATDSPAALQSRLASTHTYGSSFASFAGEHSAMFSDSLLYSAVSPYMTGSSVQPGSSEGAAGPSAPSPSPTRPPPAALSMPPTGQEDIREGLSDLDNGHKDGSDSSTATLPTGSRSGTSDADASERPSGSTRRRETAAIERERLDARGEQASAPAFQRLTTPTHSGPDDGSLAAPSEQASTSATHSSRAGAAGLEESAGAQTLGDQRSSGQQQTPDAAPADSASMPRTESRTSRPSSSSDAAALLEGLAGLVQSLIPAFLVWTAAHASDGLASGVEDQQGRLSLGPSMVACQ